jgi:ribonuclease R
MVGARSGESYRLGDPVTVKLVEAAPVAGALRFEILSEGRRSRPFPRPRREERQHEYRQRGKRRKAR